MGIGDNEGLGGHKPQFNISDDQIALHDNAKESFRQHQTLGTTVPTMSQSQQQTPLQNVEVSNFRADFDNFTLTEEPDKISPEIETRMQYQGGQITTGPISYTQSKGPPTIVAWNL